MIKLCYIYNGTHWELSLIDMPLNVFFIDALAIFNEDKNLFRLLFRNRDDNNISPECYLLSIYHELTHQRIKVFLFSLPIAFSKCYLTYFEKSKSDFKTVWRFEFYMKNCYKKVDFRMLINIFSTYVSILKICIFFSKFWTLIKTKI